MESKCVLSMINEINTLSNQYIQSEMKKAGLPILMNHVPLFFILPDDGRSIEFREIRDQWHISKSSLSDMLNKYEGLGLIVKDATCVDKRCVMIKMTADTIEVKDKLLAIEASILNVMVDGFAPDERQKLRDNITTVLSNLKNYE